MKKPKRKPPRVGGTGISNQHHPGEPSTAEARTGKGPEVSKSVSESAPTKAGLQAVHVWQMVFAMVLATMTFFAGRTLQLSQATEDLRAKLETLADTNAQLIQQKARDVTREELRIDDARQSIEMMGTTNARRLHLLRDALVRALERGVEIHILFLDPRSQYFETYEGKEEDDVGRLRMEVATGITTLRDVWMRASEPARARLQVRAYRATPEFALSAFDIGDSVHAELDVNEYPRERGKRGHYGPLAIFTAGTPLYSAGFEKYYTKYSALWKSSGPYQVRLDHPTLSKGEIWSVSQKAVGG